MPTVSPVARNLLVTLIFLFTPFYTGIAHAISDAEIINITGTGEFRPDIKNAWELARVKQALNAGNFVRTGAYSRMGILFSDRTQIRLNQKTVLRVKGKDKVNAIRYLNARLTDTLASKKILDVLVDRYKDRPSGFTRIIKEKYRIGDGAPIVSIELVQ